MANRKLVVEIVGDSSSLDKALGRATGSSTKFGGAMKIAKGAALGLAGVAAGALVVGLKRGFDEMAEGQRVSAQTAAALKSTGGAANVTQKDIENLAGALSRMSGVDDETIQSGENLLLTFTGIRNEVGKGNDIFNQATKAMLNMSVALGQDTSSSAIQLGKALNDPIKGITALRRVGVSFTEGQRESIKAMVEAGDTMGAQKAILKELTKEFGGSAKAAGETFPGQMDKLRNSFDEAAGKLVEKLLPYLTRFMNFVNENMPTIEAAFRDAFTVIGTVIDAVMPVIQGFMREIEGFVQLIKGLLTGDFSLAWEGIKNIVGGVVDVILGYLKLLADGLLAVGSTALEPFKNAFTAARDWVSEKVTDIVGFFTALPGQLLATVAALISTALEPFQTAFTTAKTWVGNRIDDVVGFFTALPGRIAATIAGLVSTALSPFQEAFATAKKFIGNRIDDIVTFFVNLPGKILATIAGLVSTALEPFQEAFTAAKNFIVGALGAIGTFFVNLPAKIAGTIANLVSTGLAPFQTAFTTATDAVMKGLNAVKDGIKWIGEQAGDVLQAGVGGIKSALGAIGDAFSALAKIIGGIVSAVQWLIDNIPKIPKPDLPDLTPGFNIPGLATGGVARRGMPYIVGEQGPELFTPGFTGRVFPARITEQLWRDLLDKARKGLSSGAGGITFGGGDLASAGDEVSPLKPEWANWDVWQSAVNMAVSLGKLSDLMNNLTPQGSIATNARLLDLMYQNRIRKNWLAPTPRVRGMLDQMRAEMLSGSDIARMYGLKRGGINLQEGWRYLHRRELVAPLDSAMGKRYMGGFGRVEVNIHGTVIGGRPDEIARALAPEIESALARRGSRNGGLAFT